jgi:hypothetical protein
METTMRKFVSACAAALFWASAGAPAFAAPDDALGVALMFAVVNSDGTLDRGSGARSVSQDGAGKYRVVFDRDVSECVYPATTGIPFSASSSGGSPLSEGVTHVASLAGVPEGVFVTTYDFAGNLASRSFHLMVFCAK